MNFFELEQLMSSRGISSLVEIARTLNTTPQAVSNWKSRNQIPHHIVAKLNQSSSANAGNPQLAHRSDSVDGSPLTYRPSAFYEQDTISLSDVLLTIAEQLKVIVLTAFIFVFVTFTYVQFIQAPQYVSRATMLLHSSSGGENNLSGLAGLASQFGVSVPVGNTVDLSSPSFLPEILRSRTFAEKILSKKFYIKKFDKKLSLLAILTHGDTPPNFGRDTLVTMSLSSLEDIIDFNQDPKNNFCTIRVTTSESIFSKELAEVVITELENLNRYFKSQTVSEKTSFIETRIASVEGDLEASEKSLKDFKEHNRQISSPALELDRERFERNVETQKGIYLTLKQQLELAKIEEVQKTSIIQVLDKPQIPISSSNKNLVLSVILSGILGIGLGVIIGFVRAYADNSDMDERKKLRRMRNFIKKKSKDLILDRRISGIISLLLIIGSPFYLGYRSQNPVFFGMYSAKLMLVNTIYILTLLFFFGLFIYLKRKKQ